MSSIRLSARILPGLLAGLALAGGASAQQELFHLNGADTGDILGSAVAAAGDVNGDGTPDILVAGFAAGAGAFQFGRVHALSGKGGAILQTWNGTQVGGTFGGAVAGVGDIDKDGCADVLIGAAFSDVVGTNSGKAALYSGKTGALIREHLTAPTGAEFGSTVTGLGDIDADGWPDYAIGAPGYVQAAANLGRIYVYSGKTGAELTTLTGTVANSDFGTSIDDAGDVNGDGLHDLVLGEPYATTGGRFQVRSGANLALTLFSVAAPFAGETFGRSVSNAGDVNGDGFADVIVGGYFANAASGVARVYLGPAGTPSWVFHGDFDNDHLGNGVDAAGDVDKDGFDDLIVGAYQNGFSASLTGYVRIYSGRTGLALYQTLAGTQGGEVFGVSVAGVGDVNGDGWADIAVGADAWDAPGAQEDAGRVLVYDWLQHATNLGFGGPGSSKLEMYGSPLDSFGQMDLALSGAKPGAQAWLIASTTQHLVSFKGGVIVPEIAGSVLVPLATNVGGKITIPGILGGLGNVAIHLQYVIKDAAQPFGFAMSNAVKAQFLP